MEVKHFTNKSNVIDFEAICQIAGQEELTQGFIQEVTAIVSGADVTHNPLLVITSLWLFTVYVYVSSPQSTTKNTSLLLNMQ